MNNFELAPGDLIENPTDWVWDKLRNKPKTEKVPKTQGVKDGSVILEV